MGTRAHPVRLADISSKGAGIVTPENLKVGKKIILTLIFKDGVRFNVTSRVVRKCEQQADFYGLQFAERNELLADHLLQTQSKLIVK